MRRLFGKKKEEPPLPTLEETAERMGSRDQHMDREIAELNLKIQNLAAESKLPQNRARAPYLRNQALNLLKRKKMLEMNQNRLMGQRMNLENIAYQQEAIQTNIQVAQQLTAGVKVMKNQMKKISIDGVDETMMDMEDLMADANEISDILGGQLGADQIDDAELEAEFEALQYDADMGIGMDAGPVPAGAMADPDLALPDFLK
jgi:charged multivesicular body protein 5